MLTIYKTTPEGLQTLENTANGCWIKATNPNAEEIEQLQQCLESYSPGQLFGAENCYGDGQFWTVPDLARWVKQKYGVIYQSKTSYRTLFDRCQFSCQRPGSHYRSRNELAVLDFEQQLEKKL